MIRILCAALLLNVMYLPHAIAQDRAQGHVFLDVNQNGVMDTNENGIPHVCVSNGIEVVQTDQDGRWALPVTDDTGIFVIKPAQYAVPVSAYQVPQHYYMHKPKGSPDMEAVGVAPTGPLPASIDFPLYPSDERAPYTAILFGDTQARGMREVNFITHDVVEELIGTEAAFGITLGDIVADDAALFDEISESTGQIGVPWYYVFGNHDHNRDLTSNADSDETFERLFGPSTYAFEYGQAVFVVFKNVHYEGKGYTGGFTEDQISFLENYLERVPKDKLVVLMMHVPIVRNKNNDRIYRILEGHPKTLSISAHTHQLAHVFIDETMGWQGDEPHHHFINATVCGSWWCGQFDELGIPHATMNDGAPNGYTFLDITGNDYAIRFKAARRPAEYQMNIYLPSEVAAADLADTQVLVNVFNGSRKSTVELQAGKDGAWIPLSPSEAPDPECQRMFELSPYMDEEVLGKKLDTVLGWKMDEPRSNLHMWEGLLPGDIAPGTHTITVRTTDMFGQTYTGKRILRVR